MVSTNEYSKIFESGIDFAVNAINEHCKTNYKGLADVILAIKKFEELALDKVELQHVLGELKNLLKEVA